MVRRWTLYLLILLSFYGFLIVKMAQNPVRSQFAMNDFAIFYGSAQQYREGQSLYARVDAGRFVGWPPEWGPQPDFLRNLNPPFFMLLILPFTLLPFAPAFIVWSVLSLLAGVLAVRLVEKGTRQGETGPLRPLGFLILLLAFFPTWANVQFGQVGLFLFVLLATAWGMAREGQDGRAGLFLGLAIGLKLFVALFALFFLARRRWKALIFMGLSFLLTVALGVLVLGTESYRQYQSSLAGITWHATTWNASFLGFFTRLLGGSENVSLFDQPAIAHSAAALFSVIAAFAVVKVSWPKRQGLDKEGFDLGFSLTLVAMLLISPLGWLYYFPPLLLAMATIWRLSQPMARRSGIRIALIGAGLLASVPRNLIAAARVESPLDWFLWGGVYFYSLVILATLLIYLAVISERPVTSDR